MPLVEYSGVTLSVDDEGYLVDYDDWNEKVACALAEREGIDELTKDRMDILKFMREYYKRYNYFPILGAVCKNVHKPRECVTEQFVDPLTAWKISGLPNPGEHVAAYLRGEGGIA